MRQGKNPQKKEKTQKITIEEVIKYFERVIETNKFAMEHISASIDDITTILESKRIAHAFYEGRNLPELKGAIGRLSRSIEDLTIMLRGKRDAQALFEGQMKVLQKTIANPNTSEYESKIEIANQTIKEMIRCHKENPEYSYEPMKSFLEGQIKAYQLSIKMVGMTI